MILLKVLFVFFQSLTAPVLFHFQCQSRTGLLTTWRANDDRILNYGWTIPLNICRVISFNFAACAWWNPHLNDWQISRQRFLSHCVHTLTSHSTSFCPPHLLPIMRPSQITQEVQRCLGHGYDLRLNLLPKQLIGLEAVAVTTLFPFADGEWERGGQSGVFLPTQRHLHNAHRPRG